MSEIVGKMDRKITIQKWEQSRSTYGSMGNTWTDYKTVWAKYEPVQGTGQDEKFVADRERGEERVEWIVRFDEGINDKRRIVYNDRIFDILSVYEHVVDGRRQRENYLRILSQLKK